MGFRAHPGVAAGAAEMADAFIAALVASAIIYVPGVMWLGALFGWDQPILAWGLTPFILGDATKAALAAAVFPATWAMIARKGGL